MSDYGVSIRKRELLYEGQVMGYRLELWLNYPGGSDLYVACDTANRELASKYKLSDSRPIKLRIEGDAYVSAFEEGVKEVKTIEEFDKHLRSVKELVERRKALGPLSVTCGKQFAQYLQRQLRFKSSTEDIQVAPERLGIRFIGGGRAWYGEFGESLLSSVENRVVNCIREFQMLYQEYSNFDIIFEGTGDKNWSYFSIVPKYL